MLKLKREDPVLGNAGPGSVDLNPAPEPLLAPPEDQEWDIILSTEGPRYGGCGVPPADTVENWIVPGQATLVLKPVERKRTAVD